VPVPTVKSTAAFHVESWPAWPNLCFCHKKHLLSFITSLPLPAATGSMCWTAKQFLLLAEREILHRHHAFYTVYRARRFRSCFGVSPHVCCWYWNQLVREDLILKGFKQKHMFWTLLFLKHYSLEEVNGVLCGCDEKTFCKWVWIRVHIIGQLEVVRTVIPLSS